MSLLCQLSYPSRRGAPWHPSLAIHPRCLTPSSPADPECGTIRRTSFAEHNGVPPPLQYLIRFHAARHKTQGSVISSAPLSIAAPGARRLRYAQPVPLSTYVCMYVCSTYLRLARGSSRATMIRRDGWMDHPPHPQPGEMKNEICLIREGGAAAKS